jgi:hypothetical protein
MSIRALRVRAVIRGALVALSAAVAVGAMVLWVHSHFRYISFDVVDVWHRAPDALTSMEATIFTYRGGIGLMLRRRCITLDARTAEDMGWNAQAPSLHIGPAIDRDEYAVGDPVFDLAGLYVGHSDGPHNGQTTPSRVLDYVLVLPPWLVAVLCLVWPMRALLRRWRQRSGSGFEVLTAPAPT